MKRSKLLVLFVLLLNMAGLTKGYAYDFEAVCPTGQTLYYNIIDATNHYVELTYPGTVNSYGSGGWDGFTPPSGAIILPESVQHENIEYTVTSIGDYVFYDCGGLSGSLTIPNSVTSIGYRAFTDCTGFTGSLTISNSVTSIGGYAFYNCKNFTGSLTIPNSVTSIGARAFDSCTGFNGSLIIPNSVTSIGESAFNRCAGFNGSLTIGDAVTTIGNSAFNYCTGFTGSLIIPNSVTSIGGYAFYNCTGFTGSLIIPNSVTSIGESAFNNCTGFTGSLTIGNSVTTIGKNAFYRCRNFTGSLTIGNAVTSIGESAFYQCAFTGSLTIPNSVSSIGKRAFFENRFNGSLTIGNSLTTIPDEAFRDTKFIYVTIGNSVTSINSYAFRYCNKLLSLTLLCEAVPALSSDAFNNIPTTFPIYVPYESLNAYKTATNWSDYESRIYPCLQKNIVGHETSNGKWAFIASPLMANTAPTAIDNMISETGANYDLYRFNQAGENGEWQNYKAHTYDFTLANGQGYLYANAEDVNVIFKGTFNEDETKEVNLDYDANVDFAGWNLVGNPFPVQAYADRSYYTMNADGSAINPVAVSDGSAIPVCTGVMVQATATGQSVTFSKTAPSGQVNQGNIQIAVVQNNTRSNVFQDKAIVSFNAGDELGKFMFNNDNAKLYIPQGNEDYAIACAEEQGEMPLNFVAKENGNYTLSVNPENVEMSYLHLIDNMTGTDVDLLQTAEYTFTAKTDDYASRFRLVFNANDASTESASDAPFAYYVDGEIRLVVETCHDASLQIVDVMGRVIVSRGGRIQCVPTSGMTSGVYVLRLIDGDNIRTQKIVID